MSNKKLFWLVFIILSICEFGQFAYSQNNQGSIVNRSAQGTSLCVADNLNVATPILLTQPVSHSLPR